MKSLYDFTYEELKEYALSKNWKAFRGHQIFQWLYRKRVSKIEDMSDLAKDARAQLESEFVVSPLTLVDRQVSQDGTRKYLFALDDGSLIETVLMKFDYGNSVCVTTQVGCNMACTFCASGLTKKKRDLTSGEMVAQFVYVQQDLDELDERLSHIVVMGTGEPFDNYDNVMRFLDTVNSDQGLAIGARHITISTCGIVPKIREFADAKKQYNLAISLHAPNDELRRELMPINKAYPLNQMMDALDYYATQSNRRLTFEYILLKDVNTSMKNVDELAKLVRGKNAYINLIPYNAVDENGYQGVSFEEAMKFYDALTKKGVRCTIRKENGADIDAACGQLRIKHMKKQEV